VAEAREEAELEMVMRVDEAREEEVAGEVEFVGCGGDCVEGGDAGFADVNGGFSGVFGGEGCAGFGEREGRGLGGGASEGEDAPGASSRG